MKNYSKLRSIGEYVLELKKQGGISFLKTCADGSRTRLTGCIELVRSEYPTSDALSYARVDHHVNVEAVKNLMAACDGMRRGIESNATSTHFALESGMYHVEFKLAVEVLSILKTWLAQL